jgi:uncharacterized protein with HEPN domain
MAKMRARSLTSPPTQISLKVLDRLVRSPVRLTAHQWLAKGLLPYGHLPYRRTMSPVHQLELVERYPGLYRVADNPPIGMSSPFAREGFAVGDGWFRLIERLSAKMATDPELVVAQVKEKFGTLRFYLKLGANLRPDLRLARDRAVRESAHTCEVCGNPGKLLTRWRGWLAVRCGPCHWLDDMVETCRTLTAECAWRVTLAKFRKDGIRMDAAKRYTQRLGRAASHQSTKRRERLRGIDWKRLDRLRLPHATEYWTAVRIWTFVKKDVPSIERALR